MKKVLMCAVVASMLASCSNNEEISNATASNELGVNVNLVKTKAMVNSFTASTPIGLILEGTGYTTEFKSYFQANDNAAWVPSVADPVINPFYLSNETATIYGVFPFPADKADVETATKTLKKVEVLAAMDFQSTAQKDYMYATARTGAGTELDPYTYPLATANNTVAKKTVNLFFHHALSKLTFKIKKTNYTGKGEVLSLTLTSQAGNAAGLFLTGAAGVMNLSAVTEGTPLAIGTISGLDVPSKTITLTGADNAGKNAINGTTLTTDYRFGKVKVGAGDTEADYAFIEAMVAPISLPTTVLGDNVAATDANSIILKINIDGTDKEVALPIGIAKWEAGINYIYTISVGATGLNIAKDGITIKPWDEYKGAGANPELSIN